VAEVLGNMPCVVLDHLGGGLLIGTDHGAPVFGVELTGELCRAHQITEQHGELPPFRFGGDVRRLRGHSWFVMQGVSSRSLWWCRRPGRWRTGLSNAWRTWGGCRG